MWGAHSRPVVESDGAVPADGAGDLTITLGQTLNVEVVGKNTKKIAFTPECTHQYIFQSTGTGDTYGYIFDANGKRLAYDDDSGDFTLDVAVSGIADGSLKYTHIYEGGFSATGEYNGETIDLSQ